MIPSRIYRLCIACIVTCGLFFMLQPYDARAGILQQMSFQGRLRDSDGTIVSNGDYDVVFRLYTASSGGTAQWTESYTGENQVSTQDGIFNVMLGSLTSLGSVNFNSDSWYLGITVGNDSEMTPRIRLGATPYAFNANQLGGQNESAFLLLAGRSGGQTITGGTASGNNLTLRSTAHATKGKILFGTSAYDEATNRLGVGTDSPEHALHVMGNMRAQGSGDRSVSINRTDGKIGALGAGSSGITFAFDSSGIFAITAVPRSTLESGNVGGSASVRFHVGNDGFVSINSRSTSTGPARLNVYNDDSSVDFVRLYDGLRKPPAAEDPTLTYVVRHDGQTGIGVDSPHASALLDLTSTTRGLLLPRMTTTQRNNISSPANGLMIYNTSTNRFQGRANGTWVDLH